MNITIVGGGKVGKTLIKCLLEEGHNITVIEKRKETLENILDSYDVAGIIGSGAVAKTLEEAGTAKSDLFISVTDNDELNIVCCRMAQCLGAKKVVARVRDTEYSTQAELMRTGFGIDMIVNPEQATAEEVANLLRFPFATAVSSFEKGKVVSVEIKVPEDCEIVGKTVEQIVKETPAELIVGAILRGEETIIPKGSDVVQAHDFVTFISAPSRINAFFKKTGIFNQKVKNVLIIGASRISYHLIKKLQDSSIMVKVIEKDPNRCSQILEAIDKVDVVCADGTQRQVLDEEGLKEFDACVSLTGIDEQNIIISLYAKSKSVETVISKVNNDTFDGILENINLDSNISPKDVVASQIIQYTRSIRAKEEDTIESLRKMVGGKLEILELNVNSKDELIDKQIKDLKLKDNTIIASVIRKNEILIPNGDLVLNQDDKIIVATTVVVNKLESIIK